MTELLLKWFIKDYRDTARPSVREKYGRLAGTVGIISNVFFYYKNNCRYLVQKHINNCRRSEQHIGRGFIGNNHDWI